LIGGVCELIGGVCELIGGVCELIGGVCELIGGSKGASRIPGTLSKVLLEYIPSGDRKINNKVAIIKPSPRGGIDIPPFI
jgi:hypothetical protein